MPGGNIEGYAQNLPWLASWVQERLDRRFVGGSSEACRFIDLDREIGGRLGAPIPEIFARRGEAAFRAAESDELERCAELDDVVVATGGGAFCSEANREMIHRSGGVSVFLDLPWEVLRREAAERSL